MNFLFFSQFVDCEVGDGRDTFGRISGWGIEPFAFCFPIYISCVQRNHLVVAIFSSTEFPLSHSFSFRCSLTNKETTDVLALLVLLDDFPVCPHRGMFIFGTLVHPKISRVGLSFISWLVPLWVFLFSPWCGR